MDEHQGRKSEMDAMEEKISAVFATGEEMLEKSHFASNDVSLMNISHSNYLHSIAWFARCTEVERRLATCNSKFHVYNH